MQADKQQPSREGHTSSDVMQRLSMIHLGPERRLISGVALLLYPLLSSSFSSSFFPQALLPSPPTLRGCLCILGQPSGD